MNTLADDGKPQPEIGAVLRAHDQELLKLPDVVGVYVGLLPDEKTSCLRVMLRQPNANTERALPKSIAGYRVVAEVTGEIRPAGH